MPGHGRAGRWQRMEVPGAAGGGAVVQGGEDGTAPGQQAEPGWRQRGGKCQPCRARNSVSAGSGHLPDPPQEPCRLFIGSDGGTSCSSSGSPPHCGVAHPCCKEPTTPQGCFPAWPCSAPPPHGGHFMAGTAATPHPAQPCSLTPGRAGVTASKEQGQQEQGPRSVSPCPTGAHKPLCRPSHRSPAGLGSRD